MLVILDVILHANKKGEGIYGHGASFGCRWFPHIEGHCVNTE
jgi:hypothetical protein